jgi:hypothetical protein
MEELFSKRFEEEVCSHVGNMNDISPSVYSEEDGLIKMLQSIRRTGDKYSIVMKALQRDELVRVLTSIKDIGISSLIKKTTIKEEMEALSINHLSGYVTSKKTGLFDLDINNMRYEVVRRAIGILFTW